VRKWHKNLCRMSSIHVSLSYATWDELAAKSHLLRLKRKEKCELFQRPAIHRLASGCQRFSDDSIILGRGYFPCGNQFEKGAEGQLPSRTYRRSVLLVFASRGFKSALEMEIRVCLRLFLKKIVFEMFHS
jgi:hypothetical protein